MQSHSKPTPEFPANYDGLAPWVKVHGLLQPYGMCQCGCGQSAPIAKCTRKPIGILQGQPARFIHAHGARVQKFPKRPLDERFWEYVIRGPSQECWEWIGPVDSRDGYGILGGDNEEKTAHRVSYLLHYGSIPAGMCVCHHCDNPPCTNPDHLFLGTNADNTADMIRKWRHQHGETHWKSKLTVADVREIRKLQNSGLSQESVGKQYGVSQTNIGCIWLRKTWTHID